MTSTTIKVTTQTRDRLKAQAAIDGLTLGEHLDGLADAADRAARFARLREALANTPLDVQRGYDLELAEWHSSDLTTPRAGQRLLPGAVACASLDPTRVREQAGRRPVLVVSSSQHLEVVTTLALVVPVTSVDRSWPNHVPLSGNHGLSTASYAMTGQLRTISRARLGASLGLVDDVCLREVRAWLADLLDLQVS